MLQSGINIDKLVIFFIYFFPLNSLKDVVSDVNDTADQKLFAEKKWLPNMLMIVGKGGSAYTSNFQTETSVHVLHLISLFPSLSQLRDAGQG